MTFSLPQTALCRTLNWRKLFESATKPIRPNGVQRPKRAFGAELEAAEASNVSSCPFLFTCQKR